MLFGKREPRSVAARRHGAFRPQADNLEGRILLAAPIDVGGSTPPALPVMATAPFGVVQAGAIPGGGAGWSVTDVGDVNNDGYDDFILGAPSIRNVGGVPVLGNNTNQTVYLIFGSRTTNATAIQDWLSLNANGRVGDLAQLGNSPTGQTNPITGIAGTPFDGIKFVTSQETSSQLGASVAAGGFINGARTILIGAPGGNDANGQNQFTGRAYLIYGGNALNSLANKTVDLDNPGASGLNIVTFVSTTPGAQIGRSVAGVADVITNGVNDIAIGAPGTTANGLANAGAVYLLDGSAIPAGTATVNLSSVGQSGGRLGAIFTGENAGDQAGFSVAFAGNVDGSITTANQPIDDLLIGAPQTNTGPGKAYLVYGATNLNQQGQTIGGVFQIPLKEIGATDANAVRGFVVSGTAIGDQTGYAVASAGDTNADGLNDVLIGSPGYQNNGGRADLIYGASVSGTPLSGKVILDALPTTFVSAAFTGNTGDLAGFSLSQVGKITSVAGNGFLIGSPGFSGGNGTAYFIPPNPSGLEGKFPLSTVLGPLVGATQFTLTNPGFTGSPSFFGASVSGRPTDTSGTQNNTADGDLIADFIIGAPGYEATNSRAVAGGVFIFEGAFVAPFVQVPTSTLITTTLGGIDTVGNFSNIDPAAPAAMKLYVYSNATTNPAFNPVRDINPKTVVVNGVAYPNATITQDPVDENNDGIPDAIITITPRSNLGLTSSTTSLTVTGQTLAGSPNANRRWIASATISVAGGSSGGGGSIASSIPVGTILPTNYIAPFGPDVYVPNLTTLSALSSYKPIPQRVALHQFGPAPGFGERIQQFYHPTKVHKFGYLGGGGRNGFGHTGHRTTTLGWKVFTREKYHPGKVFNFTHKVPVVPVNLQKERFTTNGANIPKHYYLTGLRPRILGG